MTKNALARMILLAGLSGLACCSSSGRGSKETASEMALSVRLNSLEERVAYLENAVSRSSNSAVGQKSPQYENGRGLGLTDPSPETPSDQQEYERQVQALCAAKGVDCTM